MNAIQYDCERNEPCDYHESIHNIGTYTWGPEKGERRSIYSDKFRKKCSNCTRPTLDRLQGKGIYPPAPGGFVIPEGEKT